VLNAIKLLYHIAFRIRNGEDIENEQYKFGLKYSLAEFIDILTESHKSITERNLTTADSFKFQSDDLTKQQEYLKQFALLPQGRTTAETICKELRE